MIVGHWYEALLDDNKLIEKKQEPFTFQFVKHNGGNIWIDNASDGRTVFGLRFLKELKEIEEPLRPLKNGTLLKNGNGDVFIRMEGRWYKLSQGGMTDKYMQTRVREGGMVDVTDELASVL